MKVRYLLLPFSFIFGLVTYIRRALYKKNILASGTAPVPAISIGNLKVGGTGKTPHTEYLISLLSEKYNIAVLSRGYGRKTKGYILANTLPGEQLTAVHLGDEPMQIFRKFPQIKLAVAEERMTGVKNLLAEYPDLNAIILDDAFQHLKFRASLKIVLTEYRNPYTDDFPLPAGNLREFRHAADEADIIIVTKTKPDLTEKEKQLFLEKLKPKTSQECFFSCIEYSGIKPENELASEHVINPDDHVMLLTGIANPAPLKEYLSGKISCIKHIKFPDHHTFTISDEEKIRKYTAGQDRTVMITTEKDYIRLISSPAKKIVSSYPVYTVPIKIKFLFGEEEKFNSIIENHVTKNPENS